MSINLYREELKKSCIGGDGIPEIIKEVPAIFETLEKLVKDDDLSGNQRMKVFSAIGYFFIPDDLFPEEKLGQIGYIDDVILALCVFELLYENPTSKKALFRTWQLKTDIEIIINKELPKLKNNYKKEFLEILKYTGLSSEYILES